MADVQPGQIELSHVQVAFTHRNATVEALEDASFTVGKGEFLALVGPSGCGKSSILNLIAGLMMPTSGEVRYANEAVDSVNTRVGYMTQRDSLLPWQTVANNVGLPLRLRGVPSLEVRERVGEYVNLVGLGGFEGHYPTQLSGGMRRRVLLARTLIYEPETLLMDEPFGALDAQLRLVLQEDVLRLWQRAQHTIVFVTHDLEEAIALADRVVVFSARPGRVKLVRDIPLERPRDVIGLRRSPAFGDIFQELWASLKQDIHRGTAV